MTPSSLAGWDIKRFRATWCTRGVTIRDHRRHRRRLRHHKTLFVSQKKIRFSVPCPCRVELPAGFGNHWKQTRTFRSTRGTKLNHLPLAPRRIFVLL